MLDTPFAGRDPELPGCFESDLRRTYFAHANEVASRYGVDFDRVLAHLQGARARYGRVMVSATRHLDDLVLAVACIDGHDGAWRDLVETHERSLVRGCRQWLDSTDSIIFVRKLLAELRRDQPGGPSLRTYDGTCPLRRWLADRILGRMSLAGFAFTSAEPPPTAGPPRSRLDGPAAWRRPG